MDRCEKLLDEMEKIVIAIDEYNTLQNKILVRIEEIENSEYPKESNLTFYNGFFENNFFDDAYKLINIYNGAFLSLLMLSLYPDINFDEFVDKNHSTLLYLDKMDITQFDFYVVLFKVFGEEKIQELSEIAEQNDEQKLNTMRDEVNQILCKDSFIIPNNENLIEIIKILKLFSLLGDDYFDVFVEFFVSKEELRDGITKYYDKIKKIDLDVQLPDIIKKTYVDLQHGKNVFEKNKHRKLTRYHILLKLLDKASQEREIVNVNEILNNAMDEDIYYECLKFIYNHNQKYYEGLETEYLGVSKNSHNEYINLLEKYDIDFRKLSSSTQKTLLEKSLEELKIKLEIVAKFNFSQDQIVLVCTHSKLEALQEIVMFISKGYVTNEFVKEHFDILFNDNLLEVVNQNVNLLLANHINLKNIDSKEILLISSSLLTKNITLLKKYSVNFMSRKITNLDMLRDTDLEDKLNSFIEVGLLDTIKQDIQVLNADKNLAKRIILSKSIGDEVFENGKIKEYIFKKDEFYITDSTIDSYIIDRNHSKYHSDCVIALTENELRNGYYDIEGVIIPSGRVKNLKVSLDNIIVPSLYSKEEVKILEKYKK